MFRRRPGSRRDIVLLVFTALLLRAAAASASSYVEELQARARQHGLARTAQWRALLHYHPAGDGWRSAADGPGFFHAGLAGKTDPEAELVATLAAFARPAAP